MNKLVLLPPITVFSCSTKIKKKTLLYNKRFFFQFSDLALLQLYMDSVQLLTEVASVIQGVSWLADTCINCLQKSQQDAVRS